MRGRVAVAVAVVAVGAMGVVLSSSRDDAEPRLPVDRVVERVERIRDQRFEQVPEVRVVGAAELQRAARRIVTPESPDRRLAVETLLRLSGLGAPETDVTEGLVGLHEAVGRGRVYVLRDDVRSAPQEAEVTLAHELVHDLQHETADVSDRMPPLFDERLQALGAVAEGAATYAEVLYAARHLGGDESIEDLLRRYERHYLGDADPLAVLLALPYSDGARFVHSLYRQGGARAIAAAERDPPRTTAAILHPERADAEAPLGAPAGRALGRGWRRLAALDFGETDTIALLSGDGLRRARKTAAGWRGGRAAVWRHRASDRFAATIRWRVRDARSARALAGRLRQGVVARRGRSVAVSFARPADRGLARRLSREAAGLLP